MGNIRRPYRILKMTTITGKFLYNSLLTLNRRLAALVASTDVLTNARGVMPPEQKERHKKIEDLRKIRTEIMGEIMSIKGLIGNLSGKDKEVELTQAQLDRIKELEARISETVDQLDALEASKNKPHHSIPGTLDIVGKLEVLQDLFHVKSSKQLQKALPDNRIRAIVASDKATRSRQAMIYRAAEGDDAAMKQFYKEYLTQYPSWKQMKTPEGKQVLSEADFLANMNSRPPEQRAELIYRWSGISKDVAEKAASTPPNDPLGESETPILSAKDITTIVSATADLLKKTEKIDDWIETARSIDAVDQSTDDPNAIDWIQGDSSRSVIRPSEQDYQRG